MVVPLHLQMTVLYEKRVSGIQNIIAQGGGGGRHMFFWGSSRQAGNTKVIETATVID